MSDNKRGPQSEQIANYQIAQEIGKGSFANVYRGISLKTHSPVAIKSVQRTKLKNKKLMENLEIEIKILQSMIHPHIVALIDCVQSEHYFHLIMEYCSLGDLSYFIRKRPQLIKNHPLVSQLLTKYPSPEKSNGLNRIMVIHFLQQLASALEFLRTKNLVHRDVKPQNLLLCYPVHSSQEFIDRHYVGHYELPILKVADFGFARFLPNQSLAETLCGSPLYMAPEILGYHKYDAKADLWSVGAVLYEMSVGRPPFRANNHVELLKKIENSHDKISFPETFEVDPEIKRVICGLLKLKPIERMSFNEFFKDPLILYDLNEEISDSEILDHSSIDENLFISEYLPNNGPIVNKTLPITNPTTILENTKEVESKEQTVSKKSEIDKSFKKEVVQPTTKEGVVSNINLNGSNDTDNNQEIPLANDINNKLKVSNTNLGSSSLSKFKSNPTELLNEKDYVVVEKRSVEVNALADELANLNTNGGPPNVSSRKSYERRRRSSSSSQRRPSLGDRRFSIALSPSNALSKALVLASTKLWGNNTYSSKEAPNYYVEPGYSPSNINNNLHSNNNNNTDFHYYQQNNSSGALVQSPGFSTSPGQGFINNINNNNNNDYNSNEVVLYIINQLENLAGKAHALHSFAQVKFTQLIPSTPAALGSAIADDSDDEDFIEDDKTSSLPPIAVRTISEEGLALYVKTLSLLAKATNLTISWFQQGDPGNLKTSAVGFSTNDFLQTNDSQLTTRLNALVQWNRDLFNQCIANADFMRLKLEEANKKLEYENYNFDDKNPVVVEKLIFDRALEISRNAAVNELVGEDFIGCESAYSASIWMLQAILDTDDNSEEISNLDEEDKAMVQKFISSISNRLNVLRKKMETFNQSSITQNR